MKNNIVLAESIITIKNTRDFFTPIELKRKRMELYANHSITINYCIIQCANLHSYNDGLSDVRIESLLMETYNKIRNIFSLDPSCSYTFYVKVGNKYSSVLKDDSNKINIMQYDGLSRWNYVGIIGKNIADSDASDYVFMCKFYFKSGRVAKQYMPDKKLFFCKDKFAHIFDIPEEYRNYVKYIFIKPLAFTKH